MDIMINMDIEYMPYCDFFPPPNAFSNVRMIIIMA